MKTAIAAAPATRTMDGSRPLPSAARSRAATGEEPDERGRSEPVHEHRAKGHASRARHPRAWQSLRSDSPARDTLARVAPIRFNFTRDVVEAQDPATLALRFCDRAGAVRDFTFGEVTEGSARWAGLLRGRGIARGDRVLVLIGKTPDWFSVMLAGLKVGRGRDPVLGDAAREGPRLPCPPLRAPGCSSPTRARAGRSRRCRESPRGRLRRRGRARRAGSRDGGHGRRGSRVHPLHLRDDEGSEGRRARAPLHLGEARAGRALARRADRTTSCGARPARAGRSRSGTSCSARGAGARRPSSTRAAFDPAERFRLIGELGATVLCQAPTEYRLMAKLDGLDAVRPLARPPHGLGRRAAQPGGDPRVRAGVRPDDPRRLRADREHAARRELPRRGDPARARWASRRRATTCG